MAFCPHCKQDLPASSFFANAGRASGLSILCKTCYRAYEGTPERRAKRTWNTINARSGSQQSYEHVQVRMTRDEFLAWAVPAYEKWMSLYPGQTPSLDRIDPAGHYELTNLRILERGENNRLGRNHHNVHAPLGMAWCHVCKEYLPTSQFWRNSSNHNGLQKRCKPCHMAATKSRSSPSPAP
jgi:hypothetical protein